MADVRGQLVGKYELLTKLSAGGMAELFLGCTSGPGGFRKYVAIKRIHPGAAQDENFVRMFLDEARITAGFSHPNIAQVYDLGEDDEGLHVVMEFIAGQNLNQVMATCAAKQAVLPLGFSVSVLHDCALALHYAHTYRKPSGEEYPVVHRDVAQKNIMVTYDGQVKLLDFGIAKARGALSRTKVGTVKGTTGYMSPEQVQGQPLDARSDVFALGVVLWEMVTGTRLFSAETEMEELRLILEKPIESPTTVEPVVPEALSRVILRALERERDRRWSSARELARALASSIPELLFDVEQRTAFMKELFQENIERTEALFDAAGTDVSSGRLERVVEDWRKGDATPSPKKQAKARVGGSRTPARRREELITDEELQLQAQVDALTRPTTSTPRSLTLPLLLVIGVAAVGAMTWKLASGRNTRTPSGLQRFPGEPEETSSSTSPVANPMRPIDAIPGRPTVDSPPKTPEVDDPVNAATPLIVLPDPMKGSDSESGRERKDPRRVDRSTKGKGDITLALLPSATVFKGKQELGRGSWIQLSLPAGTHLLTVVGPDGVQRGLSVTVTAGEKTTLKFNVATDLPPR